VITAMSQDPPPRRLVLGNSGYDAVVDALEKTLADVLADESLSRSADFPAQRARSA
ncbi:short-chain dehydrogenase/reductase, partial [Pseudonocardia sp. EV170527-09]